MKNYTQKALTDMLVRQCDKWWRKIILLRARGRCEICGKSRPALGEVLWIQACHIISRKYWATRWDRRNGVAGCLDCHDDRLIMDWLERYHPRRYNWAIAQKRKLGKNNDRDLDLEQMLQNLQQTVMSGSY